MHLVYCPEKKRSAPSILYTNGSLKSEVGTHQFVPQKKSGPHTVKLQIEGRHGSLRVRVPLWFYIIDGGVEGDPPPDKSKKLFPDLAPGDRELWIRGVQKWAELLGFIRIFWDGLGAELWPFYICLLLPSFRVPCGSLSLSGFLRFFIILLLPSDLESSVLSGGSSVNSLIVYAYFLGP